MFDERSRVKMIYSSKTYIFEIVGYFYLQHRFRDVIEKLQNGDFSYFRIKFNKYAF